MSRQYNYCYESSQEEFDSEAAVRDIDASIAEALAAPRVPPTAAEIHAAVERMFAPIARRFGITLAPLPAPAPEPAPMPEPRPALTLAGWIEFASDNRDTGVSAHELWEAYSATTPETEAPADLPAAENSVRDLVKGGCSRKRRKSGVRDLDNAKRARVYRGSLGEARRARSGALLHQDPSPTSTFHSTPSSPETETTKTSEREATETGTPPGKTPAPPPTITIPKATNDNRGLASWEDAGEITRGLYINAAVDSFGIPFAFSINLGPEVIRGANDNARGALDYLRRRIARELKKALGREPTFWIVPETTEARKLHVHGGVALDHNDNLPALQRALERSGGRWTSKGTDRQVDLAHVRHRDTWACYPHKRQARTRRHLREAAGMSPGAKVAIYSATTDLRREGRRLYALERAAINRR